VGDLTASQVAALNVALNEAKLIGLELDVPGRRFAVTLSVLSLPPDDGPPRTDPRLSFVLEPVGRLAVSFRRAHWDDKRAAAIPISVEDLPSVAASFGQLPIYGWEFFDAGVDAFADSSRRLSLDVDLGPGRTHTLDVFQEGSDAFLDLRVWFDGLTIRRPEAGGLVPASIEDVAAAGKRWWDGLYAGDPRTNAAEIVPLEGPPNNRSRGP
jgi:hypothetical protein